MGTRGNAASHLTQHEALNSYPHLIERNSKNIIQLRK